ncbi:MAG TPA: hypothetical protein VFS29_04900 [Motilibacteraceae bacterium]|nr:hypothetical protein [Motilibacteraceae bacterium]
MTRRGFSTVALRRQRHDPAATFQLTGDRSNASRICRPILDRLELYTTGVMPATLPGGNAMTVRGIFPPRGFWYTPQDRARIEEAPATWRSRRPNGAAYQFSGAAVTVDGVPATLAGGRRRTSGQVCYYFTRPGAPGRSGDPDRPRRPPLPHQQLAESIIDGLARAEAPLTALLPTDHDPDAPRRAALAALNRQVADLERDQRTAVAQFQATSPSYEPDPEIRAALRRAYQEQREQLREVTASRDRAAGELAASDPLRGHGGLPEEQALAALARLAQPGDLTDRALWLGTLHQLQVHTNGQELRWHGQLLLRSAGRLWPVPFTGAVAGGPDPRCIDRVGRARHGVRAAYAGVPLPASLGPEYRELLPEVRALLGTDPPLLLTRIADPRLLRLSMAVVHPALPARQAARTGVLAGPPLPARALPRLAARLGEPLALLQRIRALWVDGRWPQRRWLHFPAPLAAAGFAAAAAGKIPAARLEALREQGVIKEVRRGRLAGAWADVDRLVLRPCPHCGSRRLTPCLLREVAGPVCLRCRRDAAGVGWPRDPYDTYLEPLPPH